MKLLLKNSDIFFDKNKHNFWKDITQLVVASVLFSLLTTFTIYEGWTASKLTAGFLESFVAIEIATISGMIIIIAATMLLTFRTIKKTYFEKMLFIIAYSATPALMLGWIPHGFVKIVAILWSLVFIKVGIEVSLNKSQKHATLAVIGIAIILAILMLITETYLISPL